MDGSPEQNAPETLANESIADLVRVKLPENDLSYDTIKNAIYAQTHYLFDKGQSIAKLLLSKDLFEILNRRLVFTTAAHKDRPHFITPYGNLQVEVMDPALDESLSFIVSA